MVIRSQDKHIIANWNNIQGFQMVEVPTDGSYKVVATNNDIYLIFAVYDSKDKAERVLWELFDNIRNNETYYQFPQNDEIF